MSHLPVHQTSLYIMGFIMGHPQLKFKCVGKQTYRGNLCFDVETQVSPIFPFARQMSKGPHLCFIRETHVWLFRNSPVGSKVRNICFYHRNLCLALQSCIGERKGETYVLFPKHRSGAPFSMRRKTKPSKHRFYLRHIGLSKWPFVGGVKVRHPVFIIETQFRPFRDVLGGRKVRKLGCIIETQVPPLVTRGGGAVKAMPTYSPRNLGVASQSCVGYIQRAGRMFYL